MYANSSVVTCSEWIWCLMNTGRIALKQPHVRREVKVLEGTWKGTSKYQVTGKSFCV